MGVSGDRDLVPAQPLIAGLPPDCELSAGYVIRVVALDPTTGATVTGVTLSDVSLFVTDLHGNVDDLVPDPKLVPSSELV
jgi:hypothetical protein